MAEKKKKGFKTIESNYEEVDEKVLARRKQMLKTAVRVVIGMVLLVLTVELIYALRRYDEYEVTYTIERSNSSATQYIQFKDYLLEYSNDGITCVTTNREIVWNQSFEMISPKVQIGGDYLTIYDEGGTDVFIMTEAGVQKNIETTAPIQTVCLAEQGTIAVLMKEDQQSQVKLFDKKGNELANGKFYAEKGGFPVDIALSKDGTKLAVDLVDVSKGNVSTTISFYNFGSVGQSEIDNNVGTYTFEGVLVPEIDYVSNSRMVGMGTGRMLVFEGSQKPELAREVLIEEEILSYFHNEKYVGIVYDNIEEEDSWHIKVMDMRGNTVMENNVSILFDEIEFLQNDEICVRNTTECELFTTYSIKKFSYTFDKEIYKILAGDGSQDYTFIFKDTIEEVSLK